MKPRLSLWMVALGLIAALAACGEDDGASVRDLGGTASSGSGSASATGASGTGSGTATEASCEPVGDPATAEARLEVTLSEWAVEPAARTVPGGAVQVVAFNQGEDAHEVVVVRGDDPSSLPLGDDGTVDEDALPAGDLIGEIEAFPAGGSCNGVFELDPGSYVLFCNIRETEDGTVENHFELGMRTTIRVR